MSSTPRGHWSHEASSSDLKTPVEKAHEAAEGSRCVRRGSEPPHSGVGAPETWPCSGLGFGRPAGGHGEDGFPPRPEPGLPAPRRCVWGPSGRGGWDGARVLGSSASGNARDTSAPGPWPLLAAVCATRLPQASWDCNSPWPPLPWTWGGEGLRRRQEAPYGDLESCWQGG